MTVLGLPAGASLATWVPHLFPYQKQPLHAWIETFVEPRHQAYDELGFMPVHWRYNV